MDGEMKLLDEFIHIIAPPVCLGSFCESLRNTVFLERLTVSKRFPLDGIRVKIIVHVYCVDVIPAHQILDNR